MSQVNEKVLSEMSESMKKIITLIEDHKKKNCKYYKRRIKHKCSSWIKNT